MSKDLEASPEELDDDERVEEAHRIAGHLLARQLTEDLLEELGQFTRGEDEVVETRIEDQAIVVGIRRGRERQPPAAPDVLSAGKASSNAPGALDVAPRKAPHLRLGAPAEPETGSTLERLIRKATAANDSVQTQAVAARLGSSIGRIVVSTAVGEEWVFEPAMEDDGFLVSLVIDGTPVRGNLVVTSEGTRTVLRPNTHGLAVFLDSDFLEQVVEVGAEFGWEFGP